MFDDEVEEPERSDERTDDSVGDSEGEHQQHPGVVHAEGELVENGSSDGGNLSFRLGAAQSEGVHEELWKPHDLQACPYQGAGGHVVDKESPVVRQEDALPVDAVTGAPVIILVFLYYSLQKCSEGGLSDGWEDEDHEEKITEHFSHDPEIFHRSSPVAETPVRVGNHDGQQGRESPEEEGGQEVSDVDWEGVLQVFVEFLGVEEGEGLQDWHDVGRGGEEEQNQEENDVDQPDLQRPAENIN